MKAVGVGPPMRSRTMRLPAERVRMIMEVQSVATPGGLFEKPAIVLKDIVVSHFATTGIRIVVDVIYAKPVVDPPSACRVGTVLAKILIHDARKHRVDLVPRVVVRKQVGINDSLHGSFKTVEVISTLL